MGAESPMSPELSPPPRCARCGAPRPLPVLGGHCPQCLARISLSGAGEAEPALDGPLIFLRSFGEYELLDEIARGGMGVVYRARQRSLNRVVALKMLLAGEFASADFVRRFHAEASSAASLRHPHIVSIYEVGQRDGQHFFSMELIEGRNLAQIARDGPLPATRAATYLKAIAEAVEYAHQHGVLHRDLKPSNILIDPFDQPRITDFGLARQLWTGADLTRTGEAFGSPAYMAPEQARGAGKGGAGADIYSLGALLYELVTGRPPFQSDSVLETLRQVQQDEPVPPRRLNPNIPEDLQTIGLKCLEKDEARRYSSAGELARELDRFLKSEPIQGRPASRGRKVRLWCRRHPAFATVLASLVLLSLVITAGASLAAIRIATARRAEARERDNAQAANVDLRAANARLAESVSQLEMQRVEELFRANDASSAVAHLAALVRRDPSNSIAATRLVSALVHRNWGLPAASMRHAGKANTACFSPDGSRVLSASWDNTAQVHDAATADLLATVHHEGVVISAIYDRTGDRFVTASRDGTARVWNAQDGAPVTPPLRHPGPVHTAEFSPDGGVVLTGSADGLARTWDASTGERLEQFLGGAGGAVVARFSPDGALIATGGGDGLIQLWKADSGALVARRDEHGGRIECLAFSPDGRILVSASQDRTVRRWDARDGRVLGPPLAHEDVVYHASFSPNGRQLLTTSFAGAARLWNAETGVPLGVPLEHEAGVTFGAFSPDGELAVTVGLDHAARVWDARKGVPFCQPFRQLERVVHASFDAGGTRLVTASFDGFIQVWDIRPRRALPLEMRHEDTVSAVALQPGGELVLSGSADKTARLWSARTGEAVASIYHDAAVAFARFSPDGRQLVTATEEGQASVWDTASQRLAAGPFRHARSIRYAEFRNDGSRLVTASADGTARVWDLRTGSPTGAPMVHEGAVQAARFSPNSRWIATASLDQTARVWDAQTGQPVTPPLRHADRVDWVDFSGDSTLVVTASEDNAAGVWDVRTGALAGSPLRHGRSVMRALFIPASHRVATVSLDLTARVWEATGEALTEPMKHGGPATQLEVSADGLRLLTGGWNSQARVWDAPTGRPVTEWLDTHGAIITASFDAQGNRFASGAENLVRVWDIPAELGPVPPWFPAWAEAIAGMKLTARGNLELIARLKSDELMRQFVDAGPRDIYQRVAQWFLADPASRTRNPF